MCNRFGGFHCGLNRWLNRCQLYRSLRCEDDGAFLFEIILVMDRRRRVDTLLLDSKRFLWESMLDGTLDRSKTLQYSAGVEDQGRWLSSVLFEVNLEERCVGGHFLYR